jgi:hypothetical protein
MALSLTDLKAQANVTGDADDALLTRLLSVATKMVEKQLGYALDDDDILPDGAPADLEHAVYLVATHLYENREATLIGLTGQALPLGVPEILAEHRNYTYAAEDDDDGE